jgi:hypothetical protein
MIRVARLLGLTADRAPAAVLFEDVALLTLAARVL